MRKEEHRLDGYIRALMEIEIRQIDIDGSADTRRTELCRLTTIWQNA
jgi:hypothetical protein